MSYYTNSTQTPNTLLDDIMKTLTDTELRVVLTIIRRTIGYVEPGNPKKRKKRAWISQKLFGICTGKSGKAISNAIDSLVQQNLIEVTNKQGEVLPTKSKRRGATRLYYASLLRLDEKNKQASDIASHNPVTSGNTIKLNKIKLSCYNTSQGVKRLSDVERFKQIATNRIPVSSV